MRAGTGFVGDILGGATDFLFGSDDQSAPPQAFRGPGWEQQGQLLNLYNMGQMMTPEMMEKLRVASSAEGANPQLQSLYQAMSQNPFAGGGQQFTPGQAISGQMQSNIDPSAYGTAPQVNFGQRSPYQFTNSAQAFNFQQPTQSSQFTNPMQAYQFNTPTQGYNYQTPGQAYNMQLQGFNPQQAVGDAFTPQYQKAAMLTQQQGGLERQNIMEDLNRRGLLTGGVTTRALMEQGKSEQDRLAGIASDLAAQQGQQQLGATQFGSSMNLQQQQALQNAALQQQQLGLNVQQLQGSELARLQNMGLQGQQLNAAELARQQSGGWAQQQAQAAELARMQQQGMGYQQLQAGEAGRVQSQDWARQQAQAAEIFQQQGASDQQAQYLANLAMQTRQMQLGAQGQQFGQNLQGRQAALGEYGYGQQLSQLPYQNLMQLYGLSAGAQPGYNYPGSPGLLGSAAGGFGQMSGLGAGLALFCLPEGTQIETFEGFINVEDIDIGDEVLGGLVIAKIQKQRTAGHEFYEHKFENGSVVMSLGHPIIEPLIEEPQVVDNDSPCTYDILTDGGYYIVNGVKIGSTLGGNNGK